ncbi:MCE family protein [Mycolicibacterium iranicum]|uniref:Mammalian cell entry protein n=1 Tax=Mycolicibacterium iranicum TaxID=912594 RepID=A0A178LS97_MYCIR|nr:MCE family protein [Mycolicibacterium iranicum]OAN36859.1 mammalian cell entry protein [Mycolicibacterium iranicum]
MTRRFLVLLSIVALTVSGVGGGFLIVRGAFFAPTKIRANFVSATGIYPGDDVRVAGVKVGTITEIQGQPEQVTMTLTVDRGVPISAEARAVIVPQNLISARYVQLTPPYADSGPIMVDGAVIPLERTAVPVEWDEVKEQLMRLVTDLGPEENLSDSAMGRLIDSAANAMEGNGEKLRATLAQLSRAARIFADGGGNIVDIISNLDKVVGALRDSNAQIVQFQNRLATLTEVVNGSRSDLDAALRDIAVAAGEVTRFVAGSRNQTSEQVQRLANVTQTLADHRVDLENLLHGAPTAFANFYNMYNPDAGAVAGAFALHNFSNPLQFICSAIGSVENATAPETAKLCAQYLGPMLNAIDFNYLPFAVNPFLAPSASPEHIVYSPANLDPAVGGQSPPSPPEIPPAVSAYTGAGDVPPPPGYVPLPGGDPTPGVGDLLLPVAAPSADLPPPPLPAEAPLQGAPRP